MPESIQGAFLVLLGQIVLITTSIFFGVPYYLSQSPSSQQSTQAQVSQVVHQPPIANVTTTTVTTNTDPQIPNSAPSLSSSAVSGPQNSSGIPKSSQPNKQSTSQSGNQSISSVKSVSGGNSTTTTKTVVNYLPIPTKSPPTQSKAKNTSTSGLSSGTVFYLAFVFFACSLMLINIVIGWAAARTSSVQGASYTNKMFVTDLLILICFFAMNNIIMFSFGGTFSVSDTLSVKSVLSEGVKLSDLRITASALYFLSAVFLGLCKIWNSEFYRLSGKQEGVQLYERLMWLIILLFFTISIVVLFADSMAILVGTLIIWVFGWGYINLHWIFGGLMDETKDASVQTAT